MPGGDGTGPMGRGPFTGRGLGYCRGFRGSGQGRPFYGRRFWDYGSPRTGPYREDEATEKLFLQREAEFMKTQLRAIEERLKEIDSLDAGD